MTAFKGGGCATRLRAVLLALSLQSGPRSNGALASCTKTRNTASMSLRISNRDARRLWLATLGLDGERLDPLATIKRLGFVQLDTIQVVARAHHHILWSRNPSYREPMLDKLLRKRAIFEHYTHDASVIPMETYPYWRRRFTQLEARVQRWTGAFDQAALDDILNRIRTEGPLSTHAFDSEIEGPREMWSRPPHKRMLDYLWYAGVLATTRRDGFTKVYDLAERVIPSDVRADPRSDIDQIDWLCGQALDHMAFGDGGDIQRFWAAVSPAEAKTWLAQQTNLVPVEIEGADGSWKKAWGTPDIEARLAAAPHPLPGLKILNPFDPVIRERARLSRLFGFDYTIEIFTPAAKRAFGYYVYPLLEGDTFIGRMEASGDRKAAQLNAGRLWLEPKVKWTKARRGRLAAELGRFGRLAGLKEVTEPTLA
jgi:uncharacterized protein YcaQ